MVRLGLAGLGCRGQGILKQVLLAMDDVEISAVCDIYDDRVQAGIQIVTDAGRQAPLGFTDYRVMIDTVKPDAVLIFTGWEFHTEIAIYAMEHGAAVGSEVGSVNSIEELHRLVETKERTGMQYMFMENCCYGKEELLATSMARAGLFGTIVHLQGSYAHDLREEILYGIENRHYRFKNYQNRCLENYPTHELGPIARLLGINRGNRIVSVVSVASRAEGLKAYAEKQDKAGKLPESARNVHFKQGDIVTTILTCAGGETITLRLDTTLPRFYARDFTVRGTKGLYEQNTNTVFLEDVHPESFWETAKSYEAFLNNAKDYEDQYLPEIWKQVTPEVLAAGHGGMDYFCYRAFIDAVRDGTDVPIDVYDGATWMAVSVLSEISIAQGGAPQAMPDFTGGRWFLRPLKDVVPC